MKISQLLLQRQALLQQARLANLAHAYWHLDRLVSRLAATRIGGLVRLQAAEPGVDGSWSTLTALEGSQAVLDEHFTDENIADLADVAVFLSGRAGADLTFRLEEIAEIFLLPMRLKAAQAGIEFDSEPLRLTESSRPDPDRDPR